MTPYAPTKKRARKKKVAAKKLARKAAPARRKASAPHRKKPAAKRRTPAKRKSVKSRSRVQVVKKARARQKASSKQVRRREKPRSHPARKASSAARKSIAKKPAARKPITKRPAARKPSAKKPAARKPAPKKLAKRPARQTERAKRAALQAARDLRNKKRREVRAKAKRQVDRARAVQRKQDRLRDQNEKLRLVVPTTTKRKQKNVRAIVNRAVEAPPIVVEFTQSFDELFELARKSDQLPHIDYRQRKIQSERSTGRKRMVRIEMLVTDNSVEEILYKVKKAVTALGGFKLWMATSIVSSMGPEIVGSGGRMLHAAHPLAFKFQTEAHDSTGMYSTPQGMLQRLDTMLQEWAGSEHSSLVFLHSVLVQNFTRK